MVTRTVHKKWRERIGKMTKDELLEIMQEPETYNTEYLWTVRNRLSDDFGINIGTKKPKFPRSNRTPLSKYHYKCTRTLLVETLDKMEYSYIVEEEDKANLYGSILLAYMGNKFVIKHEDSDFILIMLPSWMAVDSWNVEEVSQVRRALNETNQNSPVTTVYYFNQEVNRMILSSKVTVQLIPQIPDLSVYLRSWLNEFFTVQEEFSLAWKRIEDQDQTHA